MEKAPDLSGAFFLRVRATTIEMAVQAPKGARKDTV